MVPERKSLREVGLLSMSSVYATTEIVGLSRVT